MFLHVVYLRIIIPCFLFVLCSGTHFFEITQDQTTSRVNTLMDDADDIQRQLDNEAKDRVKYGRPKTIWVFSLPTQLPDDGAVENVTRHSRHFETPQRRAKINEGRKHYTSLDFSQALAYEWNYKNQDTWSQMYPACQGHAQSPVNLPYHGLTPARGARRLVMMNYDVKPSSMMLTTDGNRVILVGSWAKDKRPFIYGGASHGRRYLFHSMTFHWPSEHLVAGLQYPMESQMLHVAAEYNCIEEAFNASTSDPLAFLAVSSLYKFAKFTQPGLRAVIAAATRKKDCEFAAMNPMPLSRFNPRMQEYACYQGSLPTPPCTEAALWLIRGRTLPITREAIQAARKMYVGQGCRMVQPMNDRIAYYFNN